jgi:hypothetical protein
MTEGLQRLVLTFKPEELIVHALYRTDEGPNPGTKARRREVSGLAREGLREALRAFEGDVEVVGTSGYTTREDILLATTSPSEAKLVKAELKGGTRVARREQG